MKFFIEPTPSAIAELEILTRIEPEDRPRIPRDIYLANLARIRAIIGFDDCPADITTTIRRGILTDSINETLH